MDIFVEQQQPLVSVYDVTLGHLLQFTQTHWAEEVWLLQHLGERRTLIHEALKVDAVRHVEDVACLVRYNLLESNKNAL